MIDAVKGFDHVPEYNARILKMIDSIPKDASVSATYNLVTQMSHRKKIYMYPNPFRVSLFGINDGGIPEDNSTEYVIVDTALTADEETRFHTLDRTIDKWGYQLLDEYDYVKLYRRPNP